MNITRYLKKTFILKTIVVGKTNVNIRKQQSSWPWACHTRSNVISWKSHWFHIALHKITWLHSASIKCSKQDTTAIPGILLPSHNERREVMRYVLKLQVSPPSIATYYSCYGYETDQLLRNNNKKQTQGSAFLLFKYLSFDAQV